jgi:hypothetical protein
MPAQADDTSHRGCVFRGSATISDDTCVRRQISSSRPLARAQLAMKSWAFGAREVEVDPAAVALARAAHGAVVPGRERLRPAGAVEQVAEDPPAVVAAAQAPPRALRQQPMRRQRAPRDSYPAGKF